jgi:hypothetical protein
MTKEETVKWLKSLKSEIGKSEHRSLWHYAKSIDIAIEVLSDDSVSREDTVTLNSPISIQSVMAVVVRCKDCKYCWYNNDTENLECKHNKGLREKIYGNDFCCYGERREL